MQPVKSPFISKHEGTTNRTGSDGDQSRLLPLLTGEKAMTLKSLNTRYLKLIRKMAVMGVGALVIVSLLGLTRWSTEASGLRTAHAARSSRGDYSVLTPLFVDEQKLTASDGAFLDDFGHSVAFTGSTVVVGAWHDDIAGNIDQGSVYVFNRQGGSWVEDQKLTASDGAAGDNFGRSVAVSGSTIVVGAWKDDIRGNADQGSAYVFNLQNGNWVETQKLTTSDGAADSHFGWSVAFSGSTVVIAAPGDNIFQGAAYVFKPQGGNWVEEQKLTASDGAQDDDFGHSVAFSGSTIVIGAMGANVFQGAAYVFNRQEGSWVEEQKLTASDGRLFDLFGWSVAISGSTIVVGAPFKTIGGNDGQGAAYLFKRQGGNWAEAQKLTASDGGFGDFFGFSVAVSGSTVVVGAERSGNIIQGSAYIFEP